MNIKKFEDIEIWKEARILVNMVYDLTNTPLFKRDFGLKEQIQRASVSCMSNIAEGLDSGSNQYFIQYLQYVRRSSSELQSQLYVALDRKYIAQSEFDAVYKQAQQVGKLTNGFIAYLKNHNRPTGQQANRLTQKGFTYTEILITLAVMAALFVPMMQLFSYSLASSSVTGETIAALNLAKWQMERVKNLNYTVEQFKEIGSAYFPPLEEPPLELNGRKLRVFTDIDTGSDPLKVKVSVFTDEQLKPANRQTGKPTVELSTLLEDMTWVKEGSQK